MKKISFISDSVISPLGFSSKENFDSVQRMKSGIRKIKNARLSENEFAGSSIESLGKGDQVSRFENLSVLSIKDAIAKCPIEIDYQKTVFVLATTKGNIELADQPNLKPSVLDLHSSALRVAQFFGFKKSYVVSNACTSGVMALITAKRLLNAGTFEHAIVTGTDALSSFIISGFESLHALSDEPCKPFDVNRKGLNLGEASATVILSSKHSGSSVLLGDGSANDANHISAPSRTGDELAWAINLALRDSKIDRSKIDFISAHGTATSYNDEMESKAFAKAEVNHIPLNSMKGYFGHTLGAAGLVEVVMGLHSLKENELIATKGFSQLGVSSPLNVIGMKEKRPLTIFLKTASGFGGCNAAVVIQKSN
ncbi:MAG TPA: beta-ketoacyl synthase [Cytophagales bacterium]|nr:beta-ketoacyl synthase [Cytophagales bacterium]